MQQDQGWNETSAAKSLNLGPGFFFLFYCFLFFFFFGGGGAGIFGKRQSVKFTEFLTLVVQLPPPQRCPGIVRQRRDGRLKLADFRIQM